MAHNYNDNGTIYEIGGGKVNVNGAAYKVDHGKVNVNGTVYELAFTSLCTIVLSGDVYCCTTTINGKTYSSPTTIELEQGTVISICFDAMLGGDITTPDNNVIDMDSDEVYKYTVHTNATISFEDSAGRYSIVIITEE